MDEHKDFNDFRDLREKVKNPVLYLGENIRVQVKGSTMMIAIDLDQDCGPSKTGKSRVIGTTRGTAKIPNTQGVELVVNCWREARKRGE